jgi:hypothetical protein
MSYREEYDRHWRRCAVEEFLESRRRLQYTSMLPAPQATVQHAVPGQFTRPAQNTNPTQGIRPHQGADPSQATRPSQASHPSQTQYLRQAPQPSRATYPGQIPHQGQNPHRSQVIGPPQAFGPSQITRPSQTPHPSQAPGRHTRPSQDTRKANSETRGEQSHEERILIERQKVLWDHGTHHYDFENDFRKRRHEIMEDFEREEKKRKADAAAIERKRRRRELILNERGIFLGTGMKQAWTLQTDVAPEAMYLNVNGTMQYIDLTHVGVAGPLPPRMSTFLEKWFQFATTIFNEKQWQCCLQKLHKEVATRREAEQAKRQTQANGKTSQPRLDRSASKTPPSVQPIDSAISLDITWLEGHCLGSRRRQHDGMAQVVPDAAVQRTLREWSCENAGKPSSAPQVAVSRVELDLAEHRRRVQEVLDQDSCND